MAMACPIKIVPIVQSNDFGHAGIGRPEGEAKEKIAAAHKGKPLSEAHKKAISDGKKGMERHKAFDSKPHGAVPFVGVYYDVTHCHYTARVTRKGKTYRVGNFSNAIGASEARDAFIKNLEKDNQL